jgi:CheY-like chemotaxis protein
MTTPHHPLRVLHVDDDPQILALVGDFVDRIEPDIQVVSLPTPADSIAYLERDPYAVECVISDYDMPDIDGVELLRRVRELRPTLPFILYTNHTSEQVVADAFAHVVADAFAHGVSACMQKGGGMAHFVSLTEQIKRLSRHRREPPSPQTKHTTEAGGDASVDEYECPGESR